MKYTIRITLILLGLLSFHSGSAQIITTIGGGYIGNNVASNSLGIAPNGVVADKAGNIYISDDANYVIRKVNLSTGLMTIIAGNGSGGYGGAATLTELNNPEGLAIDSSGNIYVADANNNLIREINSSTGNITTVAGDVVDIGNHNGGYNGDGIAATTAKLYLPCSVAVDDSGNIFISDYINNRIRKVVHSTGIINTVAGNGATGSTSNGVPATSACINYPTAITIDKSDNIYISSLYSIIEKVSVSNGFITTVAGISSIGGFSGDNGPATNAHIYDPGGVTLDMVGNIYIADTYNNRIRKVTPGGIISTVVGNGVPGYSGDGGSATSAEIQGPYSIASDIQGDLFIITLNEVIREVKVTNKDIYTVAGNGSPGYSGDGLAATNAQLYEPSGLNLDVSGNIYVADFGDSRIRKIDVSSGVISTFSGDSIAGYNGDKLLATNAELNGPNDLVFDAGKNLYIIDTYNERVRKINSNDTISTLAGTGVSGYNGNNCDADTAKLNDPYGIAVDSKGNVYIADTYNQIIRKVDISNGIITTIAGNGIAGYNGDKKRPLMQA